MDYLGKGEMLTNREVNTFVHNILEKEAFCAYGTFLGSFISAHETWDQHFTCCIYIFVQCSSGLRQLESVIKSTNSMSARQYWSNRYIKKVYMLVCWHECMFAYINVHVGYFGAELTCVTVAGRSETAGWPWGSSGGGRPFWARAWCWRLSRRCPPGHPWPSRSCHSACACMGSRWLRLLHRCDPACYSSPPTSSSPYIYSYIWQYTTM